MHELIRESDTSKDVVQVNGLKVVFGTRKALDEGSATRIWAVSNGGDHTTGAAVIADPAVLLI